MIVLTSFTIFYFEFNVEFRLKNVFCNPWTLNRFRFKVAAVYSNADNNSGPSKHFFLNRGPPNRSLIPPTLKSARAINSTSILLEWEVCDT